MTKTETTSPWYCPDCGAYLGEYPRGVQTQCQACKELLKIPGYDERSSDRKSWERIKEIKDVSKKDAQKRYRAMRER